MLSSNDAAKKVVEVEDVFVKRSMLKMNPLKSNSSKAADSDDQIQTESVRKLNASQYQAGNENGTNACVVF